MTCEGKPIRKPRKLTAKQRSLVEEGVGFIGPVLARFEKKYGDLDFKSVACTRIATKVVKFDPRRSKIGTWATNQAKFACMIQARRELPGMMKPGGGRRRVCGALSLQYTYRNEGDISGGVVDQHDDIAAIDDEEEVTYLLSCLSDRYRGVFLRVVVDGEKQQAVASDLGVSKVRVQQILNKSSVKIRQFILSRRPPVTA